MKLVHYYIRNRQAVLAAIEVDRQVTISISELSDDIYDALNLVDAVRGSLGIVEHYIYVG